MFASRFFDLEEIFQEKCYQFPHLIISQTVDHGYLFIYIYILYFHINDLFVNLISALLKYEAFEFRLCW